jgi:[acyl-carrier-protein] S-malonyltransferase
LREEAGIKADLFAGHSLGEYAALVAAEKLDLYRAAFLVRQRGEAMQRAVPIGLGSMAAVMGLAPAELEKLCLERTKPEAVVEVANFNSTQQIVIAGHAKAIDDMVAHLGTLGSARAVPLQVSAPFHSSLMKPAKDYMEPLLKESKFSDNANVVIPNFTGKIESTYKVEYLIDQIDSSVRWLQTLQCAEAEGCKRLIEVGPGRVLVGLAKRSIGKDATLIATDDLKAVLQTLPKN